MFVLSLYYIYFVTRHTFSCTSSWEVCFANFWYNTGYCIATIIYHVRQTEKKTSLCVASYVISIDLLNLTTKYSDYLSQHYITESIMIKTHWNSRENISLTWPEILLRVISRLIHLRARKTHAAWSLLF